MNLTCEQGTIMARVRIRFDEVTALPPVCVCCGAPATRMRRQEFQLNAALSAALLVTAAVLDALVWTKRGVTISLPVCEYHKRRGRRSNQTFIRGMALTIAFGVAAYIGSQFNDTVGNYLNVIAMVAFMVTLVVGMSEVNDGLEVKSLSGDSFTLSGVHKRFTEAVENRERGPACTATGPRRTKGLSASFFTSDRS